MNSRLFEAFHRKVQLYLQCSSIACKRTCPYRSGNERKWRASWKKITKPPKRPEKPKPPKKPKKLHPRRPWRQKLERRPIQKRRGRRGPRHSDHCCSSILIFISAPFPHPQNTSYTMMCWFYQFILVNSLFLSKNLCKRGKTWRKKV